jgi:hypothetical protein
MPSRKILVILIICLGVVGAVWIWERPQSEGNVGSGTPSADIAVATTSSMENSNSTTDTVNWQNILGTVQSTTTVASGLSGTSGTDDDTTMTSQLAKDFFGRYLLAQGEATQNGEDTTNGLDTDTSDQIANDVLSSGTYTANQAVVYTAQNLNVQTNSDKTTVENYIDTLAKNAQQMENGDNQNGNEVDIINGAILNQDQNKITKLDPIITSYQTLLSNMLKVPVPADVVGLHLQFVNYVSDVLSDLQSIRQTFIDPVRALAAVNVYKQDYTNMNLDSLKLEAYAQMEIKSFKN